MDQYVLQSKREGTVIRRKFYATVGPVAYCRRSIVRNKLSPNTSIGTAEHELWILHLNVRERSSHPTPTILLSVDVETIRLQRKAKLVLGLCMKMESRELQKYSQLQGKVAPVRQIQGRATSQGNNISITENKMGDLFYFLSVFWS